MGAVGAIVEGEISISFGDVQFTGLFGGLIFGAGHSHGGALLNYDVHWLAQQNWSARFEFAAAPDEVGVRFWGLSGENIGFLRAGGMGVGALVGGQGSFRSRFEGESGLGAEGADEIGQETDHTLSS